MTQQNRKPTEKNEVLKVLFEEEQDGCQSALCIEWMKKGLIRHGIRIIDIAEPLVVQVK